MSTLIVATHNAHKLREIGELLPGWEIRGEDSGAEETAETFSGNARIKARAIALRHPGAWVMADDSGLEVAALDGRPGIHSSRYAATDPERIAKLLGELQGVTDRRARFVCVIAIAANGEVIETFEGELTGRIIDSPRGSNGFGYDPIFVPDGMDKTLAELTTEEKNRISHRADACRKAVEFVENEMAVLDDDFGA